ncbi:MAG TPA: glycosyltransferase family 4 protein [Chryseosolibacter sp.]|nr:glycosyltransferase family 4 protein [Chryseosolibacter sp.]
MSTILFYSPFNQRSRDTESVMIAFRKQGHRVMSLSQADGSGIHPFLESKGIETFTHVLTGSPNALYFTRHLWFFIRFCRKHKVDIVYSHLESANFVASVAQYFVKAKIFICRHHMDLGRHHGFDRSLFYKLTYRLARQIIVVSNSAKRYLVRAEKIREDKIIHINLAYDFDLYKKADDRNVRKIRERVNGDVLLVTAGRFNIFKRQEMSIATLKRLRARGVNAKLLLLGSGERDAEIRSFISDQGMNDHVVCEGHVTNILDYLSAGNFLLHPSMSESSCVVVKEAAVAGLPVIVCRGVGDFDDYIVDGQNGFMAEVDNFDITAAELVLHHYRSKEFLELMARRLRERVIELFSIDSVIWKYEALNRKD